MKPDIISRYIHFHFSRYPYSQLQDLCKLLFQQTFGPKHLIQNGTKSLASLQIEVQQARTSSHFYDPIGNGLARIHLGNLPTDSSLSALNHATFLAAATVFGTPDDLKRALSVLKISCKNGTLPFSPLDAEQFCSAWETDGFPPLHHSMLYRQRYTPAYRVVPVEYPRYFPMFHAIEHQLAKQGFCVLAIDGDSGAGKTTLARLLQQIYPCAVVHMDDFFLPVSQKTKVRLQTPGSNVDWERFLSELSTSLQKRKPISYRRFDCKRQMLEAPVSLPIAPLIVVEGAYSHRPELRHLYDFTVFLSLSASSQRKRISIRNPALFPQFLQEWIPLEKAYQAAYSIPANSTFSFSSEDEL
ncbi:MAG: hypothetical protein IIY71_04905 [Oscillospiraceae bacterium]|nr:hypothetical protein [Oscillospiraceae bacterium]